MHRIFSQIAFVWGMIAVIGSFIEDSLGMLVSGALFFIAMVYFNNQILEDRIDDLEKKFKKEAKE